MHVVLSGASWNFLKAFLITFYRLFVAALGSPLIVFFTHLARAVGSRAKRGSAQRMKLYMCIFAGRANQDSEAKVIYRALTCFQDLLSGVSYKLP